MASWCKPPTPSAVHHPPLTELKPLPVDRPDVGHKLKDFMLLLAPRLTYLQKNAVQRGSFEFDGRNTAIKNLGGTPSDDSEETRLIMTAFELEIIELAKEMCPSITPEKITAYLLYYLKGAWMGGHPDHFGEGWIRATLSASVIGQSSDAPLQFT